MTTNVTQLVVLIFTSSVVDSRVIFVDHSVFWIMRLKMIWKNRLSLAFRAANCRSLQRQLINCLLAYCSRLVATIETQSNLLSDAWCGIIFSPWRNYWFTNRSRKYSNAYNAPKPLGVLFRVILIRIWWYGNI